MLVEDDLMIGENMQIGLEGEGLAVDWCKDGMLAGTALESNAYDALVPDLGLPTMQMPLAGSWENGETSGP